ncbi:MAG TPA: hypothetical protein VN578_01265 [Candidatus Binatia bacterium]|jgi:hypothetical protein|nr:hypothetical protein [Candidatus Binatia bacterium]
MRLSPAEFCRLYFRELEAANIPYVILHSYDTFPHQIASDVDYAVRTSDLSKLAGVAKAAAERHGWRLAHTIEPHIYSLYMVAVDAENPHCFLQLDACGHYVESRCFFFSDAELLTDRTLFKDFFIPAPAAEFGYLLAKALAKGKPIEPILLRLRQLNQTDPAGCEVRFKKLFGENQDLPHQWLERPSLEWQQLVRIFLGRLRFGPGDKLREAIRAAKRVAHPKGLHLALLGFDCQLALAVLERVGPMLQAPLFRSLQIHQFGSGALRAEQGDAPFACPIGAIANAFRLAFSFLTLYFLKILPAKVRNALLLISPSPDVLLLTPQRYGLGAARWLARLLPRLLPRADLTVILAAQPDEARRPGKDEPPEELRRQWLTVQELAKSNPRYVLVSDQQPLDEVTRQVWKEVVEFLARRENS